MRGAKVLSIAGLMVALAAPVGGETWLPLDGGQVGSALTARVLGYADGTVQEFKADGTTLFQTFWSLRHGLWKIEGERYCSQWPPGTDWACYRVEREARGLDLRFVDEAGTVSAGRYMDLK
ncbi:hypothetical protein L0V05_12635 [Tabrizicola sp. J26]|uniref:hypothetical protein n=1 Tax=Alitabrizicola rongguiensis TaxID=2909234 RepID=UPI001F1F946F|nr:hypothetical protein [Tabrizicola rongguiensis]MCF1709660.1 hypothetical protein [Tabrizicola rongguiensis]